MIESYNDLFLKENKYIFKKYKPIKKIGEGSFGNIYSIISLKDKSAFAMKTEIINAKEKMLESEAFFLYNLQKGLGFPKLISYGHNKNYNILVETLLGESLENIFIKKKLKCNIIDVCSAGIQIIDRLEWIHSQNLVHRDIKPDHFLIGINDPNVIYIIDFGLCKKYRSSKTGKHILPKMDRNFFGNIQFSSSNVIRGKESSRRDDIISLGYMLIYFIKKELPWDYTYKAKITSSKLFELTYLKETNACGNLFNGLPFEFKEFIKYAKNLKFDEEPNYSYLRNILNKIILNNNKFINEIYHFSLIKNIESSAKANYKRKSSLHKRIIQSLELKRNKEVEYKGIIPLHSTSKSNQLYSELDIFRNTKTESQNINLLLSNKLYKLDSSLHNLRNLNTKFKTINYNSKGEKIILKNENNENKELISKMKLSKDNLQKNYRPNINTLNNNNYYYINTKEINKNKIMSNSLLKESISIINKQKIGRIPHNNFTYTHLGNSTSNIKNDKVSYTSFCPFNNYIDAFKNQKSYILKIKNNQNQNLNNENRNIRNKLSKKIAKTKLQNYNFH